MKQSHAIALLFLQKKKRFDIPDEPVACTMYQEGNIVNIKVDGEPYVPGIIKSIVGDNVHIVFSYSKYGGKELIFKRNEIRPYETQLPGGKFQRFT